MIPESRAGGAVTGTVREADAVAFVIEVVSGQKKPSVGRITMTRPPKKMLKKNIIYFQQNFDRFIIIF